MVKIKSSVWLDHKAFEHAKLKKFDRILFPGNFVVDSIDRQRGREINVSRSSILREYRKNKNYDNETWGREVVRPKMFPLRSARNDDVI